jgi:hypothetical protein
MAYRAAAKKYGAGKKAGKKVTYAMVCSEFPLHGLNAKTLSSKVTGRVQFEATPGRPPNVSAAAAGRLFKRVRRRQGENNCITSTELRAKLAARARYEGRPFADALPRVELVGRYLKRYCNVTGTKLSIGKGRATSLSRQKSSREETVLPFCESVEEALAINPDAKAWITFDESPVNGNAEHQQQGTVIYDVDMRKANGGAARAAACGNGKRMTYCATIGADGHVYPPAALIEGQCLQPAW